MNDGRAECKFCGDFEPYDWDIYSDGMWGCSCGKRSGETYEDLIARTMEKMELFNGRNRDSRDSGE